MLRDGEQWTTTEHRADDRIALALPSMSLSVTEIYAALDGATIGRLSDGRAVRRYTQDVEAKTIAVKAHTKDYLRLLKHKD